MGSSREIPVRGFGGQRSSSLFSGMEGHADQMAWHQSEADPGFLGSNRTAYIINPACWKSECVTSGECDLETLCPSRVACSAACNNEGWPANRPEPHAWGTSHGSFYDDIRRDGYAQEDDL